MQKGDVITFSLVSGDFIIGKLEEESESSFIISDPRRIQIIPKDDKLSVGFIPINVVVDREYINNPITINKINILRFDTKVQLNQEILNGYIMNLVGALPEQNLGSPEPQPLPDPEPPVNPSDN